MSGTTDGAADMLEISVTDPVREGEGMGGHVTYKVTTVTNLRMFAHSHFSVIRRFSDFTWLRERLDAEVPGCIIPPLPDKAVMGRFTAEFVQSRRRQLEKFLNRVAAHPELRGAPSFLTFLSAAEDALASAKTAAAGAPRQHRGFMEWLSDTVGGVVGGGSAASGGSKDAEDLAFEEIAQYLEGLEPQLHAVQKHTAALIKRRKEMASALFEFGLAFTVLGQSEGKDALGDSLAKLGVTADHLSVFANKHAEAEGNFFEDPIRDYIRIVAAVKEALGHRGETQVALRNALADLEAKRVNVTKLKGVDGRERHLEEAEAAVTEAESVVAEVRTKHTTITDRVLTELERFKREKLADIKNVVLDYVQLQIDYNKKLEEAWSALVPSLEAVALATARADLTVEVAGTEAPGAAGGAGGAGSSGAASTTAAPPAPAPST